MEESRELTREEKAEIRKLVISLCANYDRDYGCLPLECDCYMLGKGWTGGYCRYFQDCVLPNDPTLEASLARRRVAPATRPCAVCGRPIPKDQRRRYCSPDCSRKAHRQQQREHMRKKRGWGVDN